MHLTVRMAWHDNNWNGCVCGNPEENSYCVGTHSLLSGRLERDRNLSFEKDNPNHDISTLSADHVPPCFWSINAFSSKECEIQHKHPFPWLKIPHIKDTVKPYSVFTWPFKLSFNHSQKRKKRFGNYPPEIEDRIEQFNKKFNPKKSLIFFYCNYDNPVSADDMRYLLLGCSVISKEPETTWFDIDSEKLGEIRSQDLSVRHLTNLNWAIQFSHNPEQAVLLPYREYVAYMKDNPEDEQKLDDMKVIIEEESLVRAFKYVGMDIDDDKCLYLLYKLRKSIKKMQEHSRSVVNSDFAQEEAQINKLIDMVSQARGIYPSLKEVLDYFIDDKDTSDKLAEVLISQTSHECDLLRIFKKIIVDDKVPDSLEAFEDEIEDYLLSSRLFKNNIEGIVKLCLFNLTSYQISKVIENQSLLDEVSLNPYALYEEYKPDEYSPEALDKPDLLDEPLDVYKIDIGMIPDRKVLKRLSIRRHKAIQNLQEDSPQRIRSVIIHYLELIGQYGHCYDYTENILKEIEENPLIYKNDIRIDKNAIAKLDSDYKNHFLDKLHIENHEKTHFYFLKRIKQAEDQIGNIVEKLISRPDHEDPGIEYKKHIEQSICILQEKAKDFDPQQFREEREKLYRNIFRKSFYLLTGKPGSGKTFETSKVIEHLYQTGQNLTILAPTGKAALRLTENIQNNTGLDLKAETIDRFIYSNNMGWAYEDWGLLDNLSNTEKITVENLIIDESSMIDIEKLKVLMSILRFDDEYPKRVVMVGDENQLPPIGFGKPFHDIIMKVAYDEQLQKCHYSNLRSNCRQEGDVNILKLAEAFTDKKRYYEEAFDLFEKEGQVGGDQGGLFIYKWNNREELESKIDESLKNLLKIELGEEYGVYDEDHKRLSVLMGLYDNGHVNNQGFTFQNTMNLEAFQMLSPYRSGYAGTILLNKLVQSNFRPLKRFAKEKIPFHHSDKIIRLKNWYRGYGRDRQLILSNGSIGIVTSHSRGFKSKYFFRELDKPRFKVDSEDNFDLAYTITVHKAQGSDFTNVFLIIPEKLTLLSKELIYTALTRSKYRLFIFLKNKEQNLFEIARNISHLVSRKTAMFSLPETRHDRYIPEPGECVRSKIEYIIYKALMKAGFKTFDYEKNLLLKNKNFDIHPDFTIVTNDDRTIYWEHLGMLDIRKYYKDWQHRKQDYIEGKKWDSVITTDDLEGVNEEKIQQVIDDIRTNKLKNTEISKFSMHHYELY